MGLSTVDGSEIVSNILLVDDDETFVDTTCKIFAKLGHQCVPASSVADARRLLEHDYFDLLMLDIMLPDGSGLQVLDSCSDEQQQAHIALITGHPSVKSLVKSLYGSNISYLVKPFDLAQLKALLARTGGASPESGDEADSALHYGHLVGESEPMQTLYKLIERVGKTQANVMLMGESGVGKELVARAIHTASCPQAPFVAANCGALNSELIGSELFGHEKGAFTGAVRRKAGVFERASGGTLFLDEITEMPLDQQPNLLRVLEEQKIIPVGGSEELPVDCRVISATNRTLDALAQEQCLREDLYFRLAVFPVVIPPLRDRGDDIALLAQHFLQELNQQQQANLGLEAQQIEKLYQYDWPGNVRELRHAIHRAFILSDPDSQQLELPEQLASPFSRESAPALSNQFVGQKIEDVERELITLTLSHYGGNKARTADVLGISLKTLYNRMKQYDEAS
tara:strand:- start:41918 stop:43282 length:1365 start_codon:yes stop_codon:yes gene_type:complete